MINNRIDLLRGVAILFIILLHAWYFTPGYDGFKIFNYFFAKLHIGIQLFFVLSGYLIAQSWDAIKTRENRLTIFWIKRVFKIVPLYYIFIHLSILYFLVMKNFNVQYVPANFSVNIENLNIINYIVHIIFLQGFAPKWLDTLVDGGWSIVVEVYFYILYPLVFSRLCSTALATLRCYIVGLIFSMIAGGVFGYWLQLGDYSYRNFIVQIPCFLVGVFIFHIIKEKTKLSSSAECDNWVLYGNFLCMILLFGMVKGNVEPLGAHHIYALIFGFFLYSMLTSSKELSFSTFYIFLQLLGRHCYSLFFLHIFLLNFCKDFFSNNFLEFGFYTLFSINLCCSLLGSLLLSKLYFNQIDCFFVQLAAKITAKIK